MTSPQPQLPPESAGPGTPTPAGGVLYGDAGAPGAQAVVIPARPGAERERDRAERAAQAQCQFCEGVPKTLLAEIRKALQAAREDGRRGQ
jgi:hypothetical protein